MDIESMGLQLIFENNFITNITIKLVRLLIRSIDMRLARMTMLMRLARMRMTMRLTI
jgi:hypothetical protein